MPLRIHPLFPTREEVKLNSELAYSDHLPVIARVPLGKGTIPLNILSLNILGRTCSGIHSASWNEQEEDNKRRYNRIAKGLAQSIKKHSVDVILLQEASKDIVPALNNYLGDGWDIIVDDVGIISCYSTERLIQQESTLDEAARIRSLTFQDKANQNLAVDVHNIWGVYSPFPHHMEKQYREKLTGTASIVSVIIGDTNSRVAPLDNKKRNLTTGVVPAIFNAMDDLPDDLQIPDHPDGGFYRAEDGRVHQLTTEILDFATTDIVVDEILESSPPHWPEFRMVMCLDDSYQMHHVIDGKNVFDYETAIQQELGDTCLIVRMATDCYNNKAIAIRFPKNSSSYELVKDYLESVEGMQFRQVQPTVRDDGAQPYFCVFAPMEKAELLHKAVWLSVLKNQAVERLNKQIDKLTESHWYFRNVPEKINSLKELRARIQAASPKASKADILEIIHTWENESSAPLQEIRVDEAITVETNQRLMGVHRNIFFSPHRPGLQTSTEIILQTLKVDLGEEENLAVSQM